MCNGQPSELINVVGETTALPWWVGTTAAGRRGGGGVISVCPLTKAPPLQATFNAFLSAYSLLYWCCQSNARGGHYFGGFLDG